MQGNKLNRLNSVIKRNVSMTINQKLEDPDISHFISVSKVETAPDIKTAYVYISSLGSLDEQKLMLKKIRGAANFIRGELAKGENLRMTPRLEFKIDDSEDYGAKIDKILSTIVVPNDENE